MWEKLKTLADDTAVYMSGLVILVALASFGLGRLSVQTIAVSQPTQQTSTAIKAITPTVTPNSNATEGTTFAEGSSVVASKSGTKYHLPSCPGAKQISVKNLITFASIDQAKAAGYSPAANCKF